MAGVFNSKTTFTQPVNMNDTSTYKTTNNFSSPMEAAFDALSAPDFEWFSYGLDHEWTYSSSERSTGCPSYSNIQTTEDSRNATSPSSLYFLNHSLSPASRTIGFTYDLLEDDFVFRLTAHSDSRCSFSSVRRGLETNLAELQVAGDILHPPSTVLEEGWSRLSTPALSVTSEISDETSLLDPLTPLNVNSSVPTAIVLPERSPTPPPTESPTTRESCPLEESRTPEPQVSPHEHPLQTSSRKRKRASPELDDSRSTSPEAASETAEQKWFNIEGRSQSRHGPESEVEVYTKYGESCCSQVGDKGYCRFEWHRDGRTEACGIELVRDSGIVTAHFALHFEELGYYEMAAENAQWKPWCPWCEREATTFENFLRHLNCTDLQINRTQCGCGGSINRGHQGRFRTRHEETRKHRQWLARTRANEAAMPEDRPEGRPEFVEGSSRGTERTRRRSKANVVQTAEDEEADEEHEEFVEGSSSGTTRRRSKARRTRVPVKEEPDEQEDLFAEDTAASWKRRKARKRKVATNADSDEEEFVQGNSTDAKRRRLR